MYEELAKKFSDHSEAAKTVSGTVPVAKRDLQQVYVAVSRFNEKIRELESQNGSLRRKCQKLGKENDLLAQDLHYILQQLDGLPPHGEGLEVRLPEGLLERYPGCRYYAVLRPDRDEAAKAALRAYADATDNAWTRHKILLWLGEHTEEDAPVFASVVDIIADSLAERERRKEEFRGD